MTFSGGLFLGNDCKVFSSGGFFHVLGGFSGTFFFRSGFPKGFFGGLFLRGFPEWLFF